MADGTYRGRWVDAVLRTPLITDAVRVALLALAMDMDDAGRVSVSREDLALRLNKGKARISERLQAAVDAEFLDRVVAGKKGRVAEYLATAPEGSGYADLIRDDKERGKGPDTRTLSEEAQGESGPDTRTESDHFGSGLQTLSGGAEDGKGPDMRTASAQKGSAYPDPLCSSGVDVSGDVDEITTDGGLFDEEIVASRRTPKPGSKGSSTARTSIPHDFAVDDEMRIWAKARTPNVDIEIQTERFVNHFLDRPQIKRPGWLRSWRNWMLQQQSWHDDREAKVTQLRPNGTDTRHAPGSGQRNLPDPSEYGKGRASI